MSSDSNISLRNEGICDSSDFECVEQPSTDSNITETENVELPNNDCIKKEQNDPIITIEKIDDDTCIQRRNLVLALKCALKETIASSLAKARMLDETDASLHRFLVALEQLLRFRLKPRKNLFLEKKEFWPLLEMICCHSNEAEDIMRSVKDMSHVKTPLGKCRVWLRLALMQKRLSNYFKICMDFKPTDLYEVDSVMLSDEVEELCGQLVGLNVIDCSIALKDANLDESSEIIDYAVYLSNKMKNEHTDLESQEFQQMSTILDQKNYLEEFNLQLKSNVCNLNLRLNTESKLVETLRADLEMSCLRNLELKKVNEQLKLDKDTLISDLQKQNQTAQIDLEAERNTYETSRIGLDSMYRDMQIRMADESSLRMEAEKELQLQIGMRMELEMALRLLEKDVHERQESSVTLRQQLADVKKYNITLCDKFKTSEETLAHKLELVAKLETTNRELHATMGDLESRSKQWHTDKIAAEDTAQQLGSQLIDKDNKRSSLETDLQHAREWCKTLQRSLDTEKVKVNRLQETETAYNLLKEQFEIVQKDQAELKEKCCDQESALSELGVHLSQSKLRVEDMKEQQAVSKEACWEEDKLTTSCRQCNKSFNVARRKHHCRNCGEIFCADCSATKMSLPSSAKPERVCDSCHSVLLQRYTTS